MRSIVSGIVLLGMGIGLGPVSKATNARPFPSGAAQIAATQITIGESISIGSARLNEVRTVQVYLPPNYSRSRQKYPVIYALDGEVTGSVTTTAAQFLTSAVAIPQIPEAIIVAVMNTDRNRDMPVPTEYGKRGEANFLTFLANELIPAIEKQYRTEPLRILLGHSQGGLFAHYALTTRPEVFQWYLSLDAPLSGFPAVRSIMEKATERITKGPNFRGRLVSVESVYGWKKEWPATGWAKGSYGRRIALPDETHETMPYRGIYEGLRSLFHDYAPKLGRDAKGIYTLTVLEQMYQELSNAYGYKVDIPQPLLFQTARENTAMNYGAEAVELIKRAVLIYGESPTAKQLLISAEEAAKRGRDPRLEEWAKLPSPDFGSMRPFLGAWETVTPDGACLRVTLTEENRTVRIQYTIAPPAGDPFQMEVQFVRVIDSQTLQWGVHNGRGTGIIFYSAKLIEGKVLQGMVEPVGIEHAPPPHPVTFKRLN
ncbi:MAG: alpha/beta hydrolase-fold protein [Pyrinomonadaceae bacterium]